MTDEKRVEITRTDPDRPADAPAYALTAGELIFFLSQYPRSTPVCVYVKGNREWYHNVDGMHFNPSLEEGDQAITIEIADDFDTRQF